LVTGDSLEVSIPAAAHTLERWLQAADRVDYEYMDNLFIKTLVKLTIIAAVLGVFTFGYALVESRPPKIIAFFIVTLIFSFVAGIIVLLLGRLFRTSRQSFLGNPFKVILTLVIIIGGAKILGAHMANQQVSESTSPVEYSDDETEATTQTYDNTDYGVSFTYPSNWSLRTPQRKSTLLLLYEQTGSQATCNLSVVPQDQDKIEKYNEVYFKTNLPKIHQSVTNLVTQFRTLNSKKVSLTTCDIVIQTESGSVPTQFTILTALHKGQRFMMVLNIPKESLSLVESDMSTMMNSLTFKE
jgi:hypothetical protein